MFHNLIQFQNSKKIIFRNFRKAEAGLKQGWSRAEPGISDEFFLNLKFLGGGMLLGDDLVNI